MILFVVLNLARAGALNESRSIFVDVLDVVFVLVYLLLILLCDLP